jgi:hypothetical protein
MLSSPAARGSTPERLWSAERQPIGCAARHDLIFARARETRHKRRHSGRYSSNAYFGTLQAPYGMKGQGTAASRP